MKLNVLGLQNYAIAYVSLWATAPILAYGLIYRLLAVVAVISWAMLELLRKKGVLTRPTLPVVLVGVYIMYSLVVEYVTDHDYAGLLQTYVLLFFVLIYESRKSTLSSLRPVFWIIVLTLPVWLFRTYVAFDSIDPHVARLIVRSSDIAEELAGQGLGGYSLVYSMVLLLPLLVVMVFRNHKFDLTIHKLSSSITRPILVGILALNAILGSVVILRAGYTIAAVLAVLSVIMAFAIRRRTVGHLMLIGFTGSAVLVLVLVNLPILLQQLTPLVEGTAYAPKVADMIFSLELDAAQGTVEGRFEKYGVSISTFLDNPLIGSLSGDYVGGHSAILDRFGRYGIVFGGIFSYLYFYSLINMMRGLSRSINIGFATTFAAAMLAIFNTVSGVFGVILFILVPVGCAMSSTAPSGRRIRVTAA